jgi:hypothetical protein
MKTDTLIERLTGGLEPVRADAVMRTLAPGLVGGTLVSWVVMLMWLGIRPDIADALATPAFWMKFFYTLIFALFGLWTLERLSRPGARAGLQTTIEALPFAALAAVSLWQWNTTPAAAHRHLLMGASHTVCPWRIAILALPIFGGVLFSLRRLAPTRPILAGAAAGLVAGAAGAFVYAFHCDESAAPFVALWYTFGIAVVGLAGAVLGRFALRW